MKTFAEWSNLFSVQSLHDFNIDDSGVVWLKLKSMFRKEILEKFLSKHDFGIPNDKGTFELLYSLYQSGSLPVAAIDAFMAEYNQAELRELDFEAIKAELYKLQSFSWGGDATNSLDKQIVSYVKRYWNYDEICNRIDNDIADNTRRYTLTSWYNNWSAILTEYLFKSHPKTISAIGKVKSVDFFINNIPFDLKITYFPKEYLKQKRAIAGFGVESTKLKAMAREHKITFDKTAQEEQLKYQIIEQLKDLRNPEVNRAINNLRCENNTIIQTAVSNKSDLIHWLYEQQGEMRFGAENRLFLILIDTNNLSDSWKLKRNFDILRPKINEYLDVFSAETLKTIKFNFKGRVYQSLADALFIMV